jgi:Xaa-Pro aminopeptidase
MGVIMPAHPIRCRDVTSAALRARRDRARSAARSLGVDAVLVTPGPDLRYLTGYDAIAMERLTCLVLPSDGEPTLVVPELERPAALASPAADLEVAAWTETEDPVAVCAGLVGDGAARVAVADDMWAEKALRFAAALPGVEQVAAGVLLDPLRARKDAAEVEALAEAAAAIDEVHAQLGDLLRVGRTERDVAADVERAILATGHVRVDFVIVASGPNGASPHHLVSDRTLERGDTVVVDIGGTMPTGYCSDSTRTYALGRPRPQALAEYAVLQAAQQAAVEAVRPGVPAEQVDRAARDPIVEAGYGDLFVHRTGHGIGVETHEHPYLVAGNDEPLAPGMVFSVEPGIYRPGSHGARIEDIVVVTDVGVRRLNHRPHDLVEL